MYLGIIDHRPLVIYNGVMVKNDQYNNVKAADEADNKCGAKVMATGM